MNNNIIINDDIITKYLCGEANPDEAISIEAWKAASPQNQSYFDNMEQTYHLISGTEKVQADKEKVWHRIDTKPTNQSNNLRWIYSIAAVLLVGLVAVVFLIKDDQILSSEIYASEKSIQQTLEDNSIINLEKNGRITLNKNFGKTNRKLSLSGKATFTVTHDDSKPFIIESNGVFIEDLGTVFSVESMPNSDTVYVVVNEGIVRLYDEHGSEIIIKAGEKAWYIRSQKTIITDLDTKVLKFNFKDTRLAEVVDLLEKTYQIDVQLSPESIGECTITTQFFDEEVATIITVIAETLGFKYEYQHLHYKIQGKPCQ